MAARIEDDAPSGKDVKRFDLSIEAFQGDPASAVRAALLAVAGELARLGSASTSGYQHPIKDSSDKYAGGWKFIPIDREEGIQLVEISGDPEIGEGWLFVPVGVIDNGQRTRHLNLFFDLRMAVELFEVFHSLIHQQVAEDAMQLKAHIREHRPYFDGPDAGMPRTGL